MRGVDQEIRELMFDQEMESRRKKKGENDMISTRTTRTTMRLELVLVLLLERGFPKMRFLFPQHSTA